MEDEAETFKLTLDIRIIPNVNVFLFWNIPLLWRDAMVVRGLRFQLVSQGCKMGVISRDSQSKILSHKGVVTKSDFVASPPEFISLSNLFQFFNEFKKQKFCRLTVIRAVSSFHPVVTLQISNVELKNQNLQINAADNSIKEISNSFEWCI